ncbi:MAG: AAA family ATPase [Bacilli bacterium]
MKYNELNDLPRVTKKIIFTSMKIFNNIKEEDIFIELKKEKEKSKQLKLLKDDLTILSLYLSFLKVNSNIQKNLNELGINYEMIKNHLNLPIQEEKVITNKEYQTIYNQNFKETITAFYTLSKHFYYLAGPDEFLIDYFYEYLYDETVVDTNIINSLLLNMNIYDKTMKSIEEIDSSLDFLDNNQKKIVTQILTNYEYQSNPAIGREKEINNLILALLTKEKSALLVGESGVGKTAIVEGLAYKIKNKQVPNILKDHNIIKVNISSLVSDTKYLGEFEKKVETLLSYLILDKRNILFLDELHTSIGAGQTSTGSLDLANILKPYLDRDLIKIIGCTTKEEYEKYILTDQAFKRRFERINIDEPKEKVILSILKENIKKLEKTTKIKFNLNNQEGILNFIIDSTKKKHRPYNDVVHNPDLALSILRKAYAFALFNDDDNITKDYLSQALMTCERINPSSRTIKAKQLTKTFFKEPKEKIIDFKKYKKNRI